MPSITRRATLKWSSGIAIALLGGKLNASGSSPVVVRGYGRDPNLFSRPVPWPRILLPDQLAALATLCDIILPEDGPHPSASSIGVHDFLNEWVSAPYPLMQADRRLIIAGLTLLDEESRRLLHGSYSKADRRPQIEAFDACCEPNSRNAAFAGRLIQLVCGGYYTTREGLAAIGYVGNVALTSFPEPPPEVVNHLTAALEDL